MSSVTGLRELNAMLQSLPLKLEKNVLRQALRAGANVVKAEAQQQLASHGNVDTGILSKGLRVSTSVKRGTVTASVKAKGEHGYIAHWIEFTGAAAHVIAGKNNGALAFAGGVYRSINHPGFKPKAFMRPALDGKAQQALIAVGEAIRARLTKEGLNASGIEIAEE